MKPVIGAWPVMTMRRTDVKMTRLRIGHTSFKHGHLLLGEYAPESPSSLAYYFKILSLPSHALKDVNLSTGVKRIYDTRSHNIQTFKERTKLLLSERSLPDVDIHQRNILQFQPWNTPRFHYINPLAAYNKSAVAPVTFQCIFPYHRSCYSDYSSTYTNGSKRTDYVGRGVVMEDNMCGYRYYPVVCDIIDITSRLHGKGCDIQFCWIPSHVGITGNEQADMVARSATTELPITVPLCDMKRVILHRTDSVWQKSWNAQTNNKLHCVKPVIGAWLVMTMRRTDVKLTRIRIGHTRFTHRLFWGFYLGLRSLPHLSSCCGQREIANICRQSCRKRVEYPALFPSFIQAEGVPHENVTLFICHISPILSIIQPSIQALLYADDLQISSEDSDMRLIERQLQTPVNKLVKWCDMNGHSVSASKSCCVHICRKSGLHPEPAIFICETHIP
ncbi:RNase H domain-containing protein [Trichonephila clavipes]|nr:RNase H domain-containing protein [Trichonephila clavipes]